MIAFSAMAGLILVTMELTKQQKAQIVEAQVESDVAQMKAEIQTILSTPQHCNANFSYKQQSISGETIVMNAGTHEGIPAILKCDSSVVSDCRASGLVQIFDDTSYHWPGNHIAYINVKSGDDWTNTGSSTNRVRIASIKIDIAGIEAPEGDLNDPNLVCDIVDPGKCGQDLISDGVLTLASMTVTFDKKYLSTRKTEEFVFYTPVLYQGGVSWSCAYSWQLLPALPTL